MTLTPRLALLMTVPPLLWAGNAVVGRLLVGQVPPLALNFIRWVIVVACLLPLAWRVLLPWQRIAVRWRYLLAVGVLGAGLYNALQYLALVTSTPLNVTLVGAAMPLGMLAVGALCFGATPTRQQLLGAALGLAGVVVVIARGSVQTLLHVQLVPGDFYMLLAVVGWSFYSWLLARPPAHMQGAQRPTAEQGWDWAGFLLVQALFGLVAAGLLAGGEQLADAPPVRWSWSVLAALAYVSLGASILAYRCWGLGVAGGGPALAAIFSNLTPLFTALLSALVLGEKPAPYHALAFALIVGGIVVSSRQTA